MMSDLTDEDTEWCEVPECVRPVTFHPDGLHLTIDGREFGAAPSGPSHLRLVETAIDE